VFSLPQHPYTEALLSASATLDSADASRVRLDGEIPSLASPPTGCRFHTRCPRKVGPVCEETAPPWLEAGDGHLIRCHRPPAELVELQRLGGAATGG
jgi:peptide/nickel transport system ATP-binding protein